jgi:hypothetical protein
LRNATLALAAFSTACDSSGSLTVLTSAVLTPAAAAANKLILVNSKLILKTVGALTSAADVAVGSGSELQISALSSTTVAGSSSVAAAAAVHTLAALSVASGGSLTVTADVPGTRSTRHYTLERLPCERE